MFERSAWLAGAVVGLVISSCDVGPLALPGEPVDLTVMTFNIFHDASSSAHNIAEWADRKEAVLDAILAAEADIVGLQEAYDWQVGTDLLPGLPSYRAVGRGRNADGGGETVTILFRKDRFGLASSGHFWLSDSPDVPGSVGGEAWGDMRGPRLVTWVELTSEAGRRFFVYNTHLSPADWGAQARRMSAVLIAERIAARADPSAPFFLLGDLNATEQEFPVRYLLGQASECASGPCAEPTVPPVRAVDSWRAVNTGEEGTGCRNDESGRRIDGPSSRIDYVLVEALAAGSGAPVVLSSEVLRTGTSCPSDHLPVVSTISLPAPR